MIKRIVAIGAHSLDAEIMGGPLFVKYAKTGAHCTCINVVQGRLTDPKASEDEKQTYLIEVERQTKKAAEKLNADSFWLGYVSDNMPELKVFTETLYNYFIKEEVDLVVTHWRGSMHPRHINTHDAVTNAVKRLREEGYDIKLLYGETFEDLVGFIPQAYFVLEEEEAKTWFSALREYQIFRGEVNDFPYEKYYSTNLQIRQIESNSKGFTVCYMYASLIENKLW